MCCGCGACADKCPKNCIQMIPDQEGFLYPKIDTNHCIDCHICEKTCPVLNVSPDIPFEQEAYIVQIKDENVRRESTAGGAFTAIAQYIISKNGVVFGAMYDDSFKVYHGYVETVEELKKFRNSKYVQSDLRNCFQQAKKFLEEDRWVCFSGTPCQIEGIKRFLSKNYEKLVLVDVVCHGVPSPFIWDKYLEYQGLKENEPENIRFRDKYYGYKYSTMSIIRNGKNVYHAGSQLDPMLRAFFSDICDRPACYNCKFKKRYRVSDMTIWDCDTVYRFDKKMDDDKGTTRVLCHSDKAKKIIREIFNTIYFKQVDPDEMVYGVKEMVSSTKLNPKRSEFFIDAHNMTSKELFDKYYPVNGKVKLKTELRKVLVITGLYSIAKRLLNTIRGR